MRVAEFLVSGVQSETTPELNFGYTLWLPVVAGAAQDPMVSLQGGAVQFDEAGLYLITANFTAQVTLPDGIDYDQYAEVFGVLNLDIGGGVAG